MIENTITPTILDKIINQKKIDLAEQKKDLPLDKLKELVKENEKKNEKSLSFYESLAGNQGTNIIAEIKRVSPSKGPLRPDLNPIDLAKEYESSGAKAISVLTEEKFFHGSLKDLIAVNENVQIPILRKDFVVDEYQIWEAKLYGASAVLLIAAVLSIEEMGIFYELANKLGLNALFEVHNEEEINKIISLEPKIIGVNNRNLHTFEVSLDTSFSLISKYGERFKNDKFSTLWVSESGIYERSEIASLMNAGFKAFLIGESLLKFPTPSEKLKELLAET